jgi:spermidine synthase
MEPLNDSTGFYIKAARQVGEWQTKFQKLQVYDTPHYGRIFRLDGYNMTSEREEFVYHENLIHPALSAHAAPKKVLIVGGGDGGSSEEALKHPSVEQVTMCEIDEEVVKIAKEHFFACTAAPSTTEAARADRRRHEVHPRNGRALRPDRARPERPDGPAEALYSAEFFQQCRTRSRPGGAMVLHIGAPVARPSASRSLPSA